MKKILLFLFLVQLTTIQYGQIIADHTVVNLYDDIPQQYIDEVKKMLLVIAGESHAVGYCEGLLTLKSSDPAYQVNWSSSGAPDPPTSAYLRVTKGTWGDYDSESGWIHDYGEEDWFTNSTALARTKAGISYCHNNNLTISAMGFGWCYDMIAGPNVSEADPEYGVHWAGNSINGPEGDRAWGIDADDFALTGNSINMDTYISATQEYIDYCADNNIPTKVFFTTGPVEDYSTEDHYGGYLKKEHIRDYVKADPSLILFDYADILCFDNDGSGTTATFNGVTFPAITPTNLSPISAGHISQAGGVRLAKAMWWMLARMAGWNAGSTSIGEEREMIVESQIVFDAFSDQIVVRSSPEFLSGDMLLYNLQGSLIEKKKISDTSSHFDTSLVPGGLYIVVLSKDSNRVAKKVAFVR